MARSVVGIAARLLERGGYRISRMAAGPGLPDVEAEFVQLHDVSSGYSVAGPERLYAAYQAARYVAERRIEGDVVECGVWRGGAAMMLALTLARRADNRTIWLYDTFQGMTEPREIDADYTGRKAGDLWDADRRRITDQGYRCDVARDQVESNMASVGVPLTQLRFVEGPVEETIPAIVPERIAILRLDTDWYESTRHELEHLYPRLAAGGVLLIDDYGHWAGARRAVDEYFARVESPPLLVRVDYTGRVAVKP